MPETKKTKAFAIVGWFETPAQLYHACETLRDAGYTEFDAHTPFPVHGLERAMGLKPSKLPWIVLAAGLTGGGLAFLMQWWMQGVDYPLNISGKPAFSPQAYVPITFELTVLFASFGAFLGMWGMNKLPTFFHPVMQHSGFGRATNDRFFLAVEAKDPKFDVKRTRETLEKLGAHDLEEVLP